MSIALAARQSPLELLSSSQFLSIAQLGYLHFPKLHIRDLARSSLLTTLLRTRAATIS